MPTAAQIDEAAYIAGVKADGTIPTTAFWGWNGATPAAYATGYTDARKWGADTAKTGATISCYFDTHAAWTAAEMQVYRTAQALWSAVADVTFTDSAVIDGAAITLFRAYDSTATTLSTAIDASGTGGKPGGTHLLTMTSASIAIDTTPFPLTGATGAMTALHEIGHALGLGHAGPYNTAVNPASQQYCPFDTQAWSLMSYVSPGDPLAPGYDPSAAFIWNGALPDSWMPLDVLAIQSIYGVAKTTPLSGGQVFGFNSNIGGDLAPVFDFTQNTQPVVTLWDKGSGNTLDISGFSQAATVNLNPGTFSSVGGLTRNIAIAFNTAIDTLLCGDGDTVVICNDDGDVVAGGAGNDRITGGAGNDSLNGGAGTDTALLARNPSAYCVTANGDGSYTVQSPGETDTLRNIEQVSFGNGQTLDFTQFQAQQFNALTYIASYSDLIKAFGDDAAKGAQHWINSGWREGRTSSFDALNYIASYGDLIRAFGNNLASGTEHFINSGYYEGRFSKFDAMSYIASYSDLIEAYGTDIVKAEAHYINYGYWENRAINYDPVAYLISNPDLGALGYTPGDVTLQYIAHGYKEGRQESGGFGLEQTNHVLPMNYKTWDTIALTGDRDWFDASLTAGKTYTFTLSGAAGGNGTLADPFLSLYDTHGLLVASNAATGQDAKLTFTATTSGSFYIVAAANGGSTGSYTLFAATAG